MKGIFDRFEGDYAVIEIDGQTHDVSNSIVDAFIKVGDVVTYGSQNRLNRATREAN